MMTPVTGAGNPASVARRLISVPCRPAPSMRIPMPRSSCHVAASPLGPPGPLGLAKADLTPSDACGDHPEEGSGDARNETRSPEARVILGHAALVLGEAQLEQPVEGDFGPELLMRRQGEILARAAGWLRLAHAARGLHAGGHLLQDDPGAAQAKGGTAPPRKLRAAVLYPVHEEEDVARLFLHHRLENLHQRGREEP